MRAIPLNINYRYTAEEVAYLLTDADADALFFHSSLGGVEEALAMAGPLKLLIEVPNGGDHLSQSILYEKAIPGAGPAAPSLDTNPT